jgi:hypothetical protein
MAESMKEEEAKIAHDKQNAMNDPIMKAMQEKSSEPTITITKPAP